MLTMKPVIGVDMTHDLNQKVILSENMVGIIYGHQRQIIFWAIFTLNTFIMLQHYVTTVSITEILIELVN